MGDDGGHGGNTGGFSGTGQGSWGTINFSSFCLIAALVCTVPDDDVFFDSIGRAGCIPLLLRCPSGAGNTLKVKLFKIITSFAYSTLVYALYVNAVPHKQIEINKNRGSCLIIETHPLYYLRLSKHLVNYNFYSLL
jgi:hypothetical protein